MCMESRKMVLMNLFEAMETQTYKTDLWTQRGKERVGPTQRIVRKHIHYHM